MFYNKYCPKHEIELFYNNDKMKVINTITTNMLIYGNPGIGKNTLINLYLQNRFSIKNIRNKIIKINNKQVSYNVSNFHFEIDIYNYLNKNNECIELIKELSSTKHILNNVKKIFYIKNVDQLTKPNQMKLRKILEKTHTQFIFTTSVLNKIINPLQSRFVLIRIPSPNNEEKTKLLKHISNKENIKISKRSINILLDKTDNIKELLTLLQICYLTKRFKNKNLHYINILDKIMIELEKLDIKNYKKFRDLIYSLKLINLPYIKYVNYIINTYSKKLHNDDIHLLYHYAANCNNRILDGNKPDIHFERFLLQIKDLINIKNI